jgi:hypothetical protein
MSLIRIAATAGAGLFLGLAPASAEPNQGLIWRNAS